MARLVRWATASGGTALVAATRSTPLLILVGAGVCLVGLLVLVWILAKEERTERFNLLLRGTWKRRPASGAPAPDPGPPDDPDRVMNLRNAWMEQAGRRERAPLRSESDERAEASWPQRNPS